MHRVSAPVFERLRTQALLQLESRGLPQPLWGLRPPVPDEPRPGLALLPPPSDGDVFFDMEGFPYAEGGLEYLFGAVTVDEVDASIPRLVGPRRGRGAPAFEGFIDWVMARRRRGPRAARLPLRLVRDGRGQAAHGQVRHPRGRGGRPAPAAECSWTCTRSCGRGSSSAPPAIR